MLKLNKRDEVLPKHQDKTLLEIVALQKNEILSLKKVINHLSQQIKAQQAELCLTSFNSQIAQLVKLKNEFIQNMEHDIRTPFNGICGISQHLLENESDPNKKELLQALTLSAKELLHYCNEMLDLSDIEHEKHPLIEKKFSLRDLANKLIALETPAARDKGLELYLDFDEDLPAQVKGDSYRLYRVLINLMSNAVKFTNQGFVKLTIKKLLFASSSQLIIHCAIEDTGIGIPITKQNYIFEKFNKLFPSNQNIYKGLGLGLPIVKKFINEMQGEIELISQEGIGTKFICTLPMELPIG